jgi:hypothetical protein
VFVYQSDRDRLLLVLDISVDRFKRKMCNNNNKQTNKQTNKHPLAADPHFTPGLKPQRL